MAHSLFPLSRAAGMAALGVALRRNTNCLIVSGAAKKAQEQGARLGQEWGDETTIF